MYGLILEIKSLVEDIKLFSKFNNPKYPVYADEETVSYFQEYLFDKLDEILEKYYPVKDRYPDLFEHLDLAETLINEISGKYKSKKEVKRLVAMFKRMPKEYVRDVCEIIDSL